MMATRLSERARAFLKEKHFAVLSTLNKDGSPQLTPMWYILDEDDTIVMNTQIHLQKARNIRRDPRIAVCVEDGPRYVTIQGTIQILEDQTRIQRDLKRLVNRYAEGEENRQQYIDTFSQQQRISLRLPCDKSVEYFA
jgi:PPOX class probable F420-dependent enzyme